MSQEIISKVWQIFGIFGRVIPGLLIYDNGRDAIGTLGNIKQDIATTRQWKELFKTD